MADDYLYMPQPEQPEPSALQKLWDARPWQGYAQNPPSMLPQLGLALGLLHPRLGGAMRDMGMARSMGPGQATGAIPPGMREQALDVSVPALEQVKGAFPSPMASQRLGGMADVRASAANVNNRANMQPQLSAVSPQQPQAAAQSPYKPGSRVAQYEAHLANLERQGVPYEQFPSWQSFFRGMD